MSFALKPIEDQQFIRLSHIQGQWSKIWLSKKDLC